MSEYIKALAPEKFAELAKPFANVAGSAIEERWSLVAALLHNRVETLAECGEKIAFLLEQPEYSVELFNHKKSKASVENSAVELPELMEILRALPQWDAQSISDALNNYAAAKEIKAGRPMWQVRIAVSGCAVTPGGPGEIMEILGKEESFRRMEKALLLFK